MAEQEGPPESDEEWIRRIRQGDCAAFGALFRAYHQDLVRFVRRHVGRLDVAEGLVQDVFCEIWQGRAGWQPRGALRPYLYGAARNHANKHLRHRRVRDRYRRDKRRDPGRSVAEDTPERELRYKELSAALERAIADMPERRRHVYQLSRQQGLSYAEIAAVLEISTNTVEVHMVRALKFLRASVAQLL